MRPTGDPDPISAGTVGADAVAANNAHMPRTARF
jgi:hypothetical protein